MAPQEHYPQSDLYDQARPGEGPPGEMLAARKVALKLLQTIFLKKHNLDQAIDESADFNALALRDRAFVKMLVTTVIRRLGQIDDLIRRSLSRPDQPMNPPVLEYILRLGVAQLIFMHVPDHAAVNTSVQLIEAEGHTRMKGFVNAILRRIANDGRDWTTRQDIARLNTPDWLLKIWIRDYGLKGAVDIATANMMEPPLDITLKRPELAAQWAETLQASILPTGTLRVLNPKLVQEMPGFEDGMWWVQDASAALPAKLFGPLKDKLVYDLCAAPGGKTSQLAAQGANVVAVDRSAKRVTRLNENMKRLGLNDRVRTEIADASVWKAAGGADYILLDAPCSATGTIRRNPDVPWLKGDNDVATLVDLQHRLLVNAVNMMKDGGTLIYCTCSLQKDEGEYQVDAMVNTGEVVREPISPNEVGGMSDLITPQGDLRVFPSHLGNLGGMDGFFVSRLRKI